MNVKILKSIIGAVVALALAGCSKESERIERSTNSQVPVETLFTHDGCTMYRFEDGGRKHYFVRCRAGVETIKTYSESCGKKCNTGRDENIKTTER